MPFHNAEKLSYLIGLRLAADFLQIEHFSYRGILENMMASMHSIQGEPKALDQIDHIAKGHIA
jgi:hypothetical protein